MSLFIDHTVSYFWEPPTIFYCVPCTVFICPNEVFSIFLQFSPTTFVWKTFNYIESHNSTTALAMAISHFISNLMKISCALYLYLLVLGWFWSWISVVWHELPSIVIISLIILDFISIDGYLPLSPIFGFPCLWCVLVTREDCRVVTFL